MSENVLDRLKRQNDAPLVHIFDERVRLYDDFTIRAAMDRIESLQAEVARLEYALATKDFESDCYRDRIRGSLIQVLTEENAKLQAEVERLRNPPFRPTHEDLFTGKPHQKVAEMLGQVEGALTYGVCYRNSEGEHFWTSLSPWRERFMPIPQQDQEEA